MKIYEIIDKQGVECLFCEKSTSVTIGNTTSQKGISPQDALFRFSHTIALDENNHALNRLLQRIHIFSRLGCCTW